MGMFMTQIVMIVLEGDTYLQMHQIVYIKTYTAFCMSFMPP